MLTALKWPLKSVKSGGRISMILFFVLLFKVQICMPEFFGP